MNVNKWVRYSFSKSKIKEGKTPVETMGIGGKMEIGPSWEGRRETGLICLPQYSGSHAGLGDESFGPWKLGI